MKHSWSYQTRSVTTPLLVVLLFCGAPVTSSQPLYEAHLSGLEELPAVHTEGRGALQLSLDGGTATVTGSFEGLSAPYTASHLHIGYAGANGPVAVPLAPTVAGDGRSGVFEAANNTYALTAEQLEALTERRAYANVHSDAHSAGELRGQLLPEADAHLSGQLLSRNQARYTLTRGVGGVGVELRGDSVTLSGSFRDAEGPVFAAHFHFGRAGVVVEPPMIVLEMELADEGHSGVFTAAANTFELSPEQRLAFLSDSVYVNVHSEAHGIGELRAQLLAAPNRAPGPAALLEPADGTSIDLDRDPNARFVVDWDPAADPDGHPLVYIWELSRQPDFAADDVVFGRVFTATSFELLTHRALGLTVGIGEGEEATFYHRVLTSDGSASTPGETFSLSLRRSGSTAAEAGLTPSPLALAPPYPNPSARAVALPYALPEEGHVTLLVYDLLGRRVATLVSARQPAGRHVALLEHGALAAGLYVGRLEVAGVVVTRKFAVTGS